MLLRLRSPDGMFRLTVEKDDSFGELIKQVTEAERRAWRLSYCSLS